METQSANNLPVSYNQAAASEQQYLTFSLAGEMYAIGIMRIKEIIEYGGVTEVPMMPNYVRGVINLRGHAVPVLNPLIRFNKPATEIQKRTCIVIVEATLNDELQNIGLIVDSVSEVLDIPDSDIEPPPRFNAKIHSEFVQGMGKVNGKFVILLNINKILSQEEMLLLTDMQATG